MKKLLVALFFGAACSAVRAADVADYQTVVRSGVVSISTSAFTVVPSTIPVSPAANGRTAIVVQSSSTNTGNFLVIISTTPTAPTLQTWGFTMLRSDAPWYLSIRQNVYLWLKSTASAAENVYYTELR